jgi:hypothetical protein
MAKISTPEILLKAQGFSTAKLFSSAYGVPEDMS